MDHHLPAVFVRRRLLPAIVGASLGLAATAGAQNVPQLGEAEFVARFEKSSPGLDVIAADVEASRADVTEARVQPNPSISADREEVFDSGTGLPEHFLRLSFPIDLTGRRGRRIAAAEAGVDAARAQGDFDRFALLCDALEVYVQAAHARLRVEALREGRASLAKILDVVRARKSAGDVSGYDLGRLELELGAYDDLIAEAEIALATSRRRLAALVGEPEAAFDAADPLELPAPPDPGPPPARADQRAAELRARQAEEEARAARRSWVPVLVVTGGLKTTDLGDDTALGYVVGLAIELPLFDRGQGAAAKAEASRRGWRARSRQIDRDSRGAVAVARQELQGRIDQSKAFETSQLARLDELLRRAEAAYREGERSIVELLDAYRTARDVRLRHLDIRRDARLAQLALWRAQGRR